MILKNGFRRFCRYFVSLSETRAGRFLIRFCYSGGLAIGVVLLLFGILYLLLYKPILRMLDQRAGKIKESLETAETAREEAIEEAAAAKEAASAAQEAVAQADNAAKEAASKVEEELADLREASGSSGEQLAEAKAEAEQLREELDGKTRAVEGAEARISELGETIEALRLGAGGGDGGGGGGAGREGAAGAGGGGAGG